VLATFSTISLRYVTLTLYRINARSGAITTARMCTGADKPVALELPNQWLWDIIDEFIYQVRCRCVEFCWHTTMIWKQINENLVRERECLFVFITVPVVQPVQVQN
jgi:hypothetical protein